MTREFQKGDRVRIKDPAIESDLGTFIVSRVQTARIGKPCWLTTLDGSFKMYPEPSDRLVLVTASTEHPRDKRIRELEERIETIERKLGMRL